MLVNCDNSALANSVYNRVDDHVLWSDKKIFEDKQ